MGAIDSRRKNQSLCLRMQWVQVTVEEGVAVIDFLEIPFLLVPKLYIKWNFELFCNFTETLTLVFCSRLQSCGYIRESPVVLY
jgi:hypothetical protein